MKYGSNKDRIFFSNCTSCICKYFLPETLPYITDFNTSFVLCKILCFSPMIKFLHFQVFSLFFFACEMYCRVLFITLYLGKGSLIEFPGGHILPQIFHTWVKDQVMISCRPKNALALQMIHFDLSPTSTSHKAT